MVEMGNRDLFRREAIEHRQQKLYGEVVLTLPISGWAVTSVVVLAFALILYVLVFGSYARKETMGGWLRPDRGVVRVQAQDDGVVESVHVVEGSYVEAGAELVTLRLDADLAKGDAVTGRLTAGLRSERAQLQLQLDATRERMELQTSRLRDEATGLEAELDQYRRQLALLDRRTSLAQRHVDEQADLVKQGFLSRRDYDKTEDDLLAQAQSKEVLHQDILIKQNRLKSARYELAAMAHEQTAALGAVGERLAALDQRLVEVSRRARVVLTAPIAGRIAFVRVAVGEPAKANSALVDLLPEGGKLRAELFAPSRSTGFLHLGSDVQLRYDAYPYQKFGVGHGRVLQVSRTSVDPRDLPRALVGDEPVYRIIVELDRDHLVIDGTDHPLTAGTTLKADIVLERRRVGEFLFAPLLGFSKRG